MAISSVNKKAINQAKKEADLKRRSILLLKEEQKRDVARTDMGINLCSLFKAGKFDRKSRVVSSLPTQIWQEGKIDIKAPRLDVFDQDVLFGLLAMALKQHKEGTQDGADSLESEGAAKQEDTVRVETTTGELLSMIGAGKGGLQRKAVRESLDWLSMITVRLTAPDGAWASSKLIYAHAGTSASVDGKIAVQLSWRLTTMLLRSGVKNGGDYIPIEMTERRQLKPVAKLIQTVLLTRSPGRKTTEGVGIDELVSRVYDTAATPEQHRMRRFEIKGALKSIKQLPGWS